MTRVTLSPLAQSDFDEIVDYLRIVAGSGVATRYGRDIQASINRLVDVPEIGSPRPQFGAGVRLLIIQPYLIFYDFAPANGSAVVLRILHGHRNITADLLRRS